MDDLQFRHAVVALLEELTMALELTHREADPRHLAAHLAELRARIQHLSSRLEQHFQ